MKRVFLLLAVLIICTTFFLVQNGRIALTIRGRDRSWQAMETTNWRGTLHSGDRLTVVNSGLLPIKVCWVGGTVDKIPRNHILEESVEEDTFLAIVGFWDECPLIVNNVSNA